MKQLFLASLCILAIACNQTPEKKAEKLVKDEVLNSLYLPKTYEPIETKVDSAFSPNLDHSFMQSLFDLYSKGTEIQNLERKIQSAKSKMNVYDGSYRRLFGNSQFDDAKREYDDLSVQYEALVSKTVEIRDLVVKRMNEEPQFIGYLVHHSYRANNNSGQTLIGGKFFLLNKELTEILDSWDEEEMDNYQFALKTLKDKIDLIQ